jgi:hypothetical protein
MFFVRGFVSVQSRFASRGEEGQAVAEYGTVILVAVALGMAVLSIVTGNALDGVLHTLIEKALKLATKLMGS